MRSVDPNAVTHSELQAAPAIRGSAVHEAAQAESAQAAHAEPADLARFQVGSTIAGRYRIERPLDAGATAMLVAARHINLEETVAIRFPLPELRRDPAVVARFTRAAKALARIKSDHVPRVLDVGVSMAVGPYMVMEYLEGTDLQSVLRSQGALSAARAVEYVLQTCEALVVAHAQGITHRNLGPEHLFLARQGQFETLKVLDFGAAEEAPERRVVAGVLSGNPSAGDVGQPMPQLAASAEASEAPPDADRRRDIWSLGVLLHELVTGRPPRGAADLSPTGTGAREQLPTLEVDDSVSPPALREIIERCLRREPDESYQSVQELAAALMPLETMSERVRGRLTGSFRLPKPAAPSHGVSTPSQAGAAGAGTIGETSPGPARRSSSPPWGTGQALAKLLALGRPRQTLGNLALSNAAALKALAVVLASGVGVVFAVALLGGMRLMVPARGGPPTPEPQTTIEPLRTPRAEALPGATALGSGLEEAPEQPPRPELRAKVGGDSKAPTPAAEAKSSKAKQRAPRPRTSRAVKAMKERQAAQAAAERLRLVEVPAKAGLSRPPNLKLPAPPAPRTR